MKKLIFAAAVVLAVMSFNPVKAQVSVSFALNIGTQPTWGPVGYDHAEYYYMPDIDSYYDVPHKQFVYKKGNSWVRGSALPSQYHNYDLNRGYKVVINEPTPYLHDKTNRSKYASYKGRHGQQPIIRDSHDPKYTKYHKNDNHGHDNHGHDDHHNDHH